jgi:hypothetical protein
MLFDIYHAGMFSFLEDFVGARSLAAVGSLLMIYLAYIVRKELVPLLKARRNREIAGHLLAIADDVTDYFRSKFPTAHWSVWLDRAVDRVIEITKVDREVAERVARASLARNQAVQKSPRS